MSEEFANTCLKSRYKLEKIIGEGDMGRVYLAIDEESSRQVAIKQTASRFSTKNFSKLKERFKREYDILRSIKHPNIVKTYDFFELPANTLPIFDTTHKRFEENEHLFLVLEYVEGILLKDFIAIKIARTPLLEQLSMAIQIAQIVEVVNTAGVLHRDIKPSNFILKEKTRLIKLLDLGVAKQLQRDMEKRVQKGLIISNLGYMSPEQISSKYSENSDIFSLGAMLYQFFLGAKNSPFYSPSPIITKHQIQTKELPPLITEIKKSLSVIEEIIYQDLSELIAKTLIKEPEQRIGSASELIYGLSRIYNSLLTYDSPRASKKWNLNAELDKLEQEKLIKIGEKYGRDIDIVKTSVSKETVAKSHPLFSKGKTFAHYKILDELGEGGMGKVYKVLDKKSNETRALKVLLGQYYSNTKQIQRFLIEVKTISKLKHPNIVGLHETGQEQGQHFFTMDYIEGVSLDDKEVNLMEIVAIIKKVAIAIDCAHQQGIIHRDLKPENIMIGNNGEPYVMDFGLAKTLYDSVHLTTTDMVMGTPHYMSPEQARGRRHIDARSDIYSLGVILYELITEELPFDAPNSMEVLGKIIQEPMCSPIKINPQIPSVLNKICLKAMEKKRTKRYKSGVDMAKALERFERTAEINKTLQKYLWLIILVIIVFVWFWI